MPPLPQVTPDRIGWGTSGGDLDSFIATRHTASWGLTGAGKTTLIDEIQSRLQSVRIVIWNPEEQPFQGAKRVSSSKELVKALAAGVRVVDHVPRVPDEQMGEHFDRFMAPIWAMGTKLKGAKEKTDPWILVVVDEVDLVFPEQQKNLRSRLLNNMLRRGRKRGIFVHASSQRGADVGKLIPTQSRAHFVFAVQGVDLEYLRKTGRLPVDEFRKHIQEPYQFVLVELDNWCPFPKLPRE